MAIDSKQLAARLGQLSKAEIIDLILELHGRHQDVDTYIDRFLLKNSPEALADSLGESIARHARGRRFVEYRASFSYAAQLQQLLEDIQVALLPEHPLLACDIITDFIATHERVLMRSDDSAGAIADVYREATLLLLSAIKTARRQQSFPDGYWLHRFDQWCKQDPYHFYLDMLADAAGALSEEELQRLAWRFQHQLSGQRAGDDNAPNSLLTEARLGLKAVARALHQPQLYAEAVSSGNSRLSLQDHLDIARTGLEFGDTAQAINRLEALEPDNREALDLLLKAYRSQQDADKIRATLARIFDLEPSTENFQALLGATPRDQHQQVLNQAISRAEHADNGTLAANLLLELNQPRKALNLLLRQGKQLQQYYYGDLLALAENFKEKQVALGAILCYRALLEDILNRAYSKAYVYAADYVQSLLELDQLCEDYAHLPNHSEYLHELRQHHQGKHGFWTRVDGSVLLKGL